MAEGIEHYFDTAGNSQFVKNPKQIVFDGVLSQLQALGNLAIGESLGYATNHVNLAGGKRTVGVVAEIRKCRLCERVE